MNKGLRKSKKNILSQRLGYSMLAILLGLLLTLVYWNHFDNAFHFDDSHTIKNNSYITDIRNLPLFFTDSQTSSSLPENQQYRPIVVSLNAIDYWISGDLDPMVFHWHIFLEFLLLLVLLYWLLLKIFETASGERHPYVALFATMFYAFHTATAETLNYIIARSDGFSTLMILVSMNIFIWNRNWKQQLGLIPFAIGCLAKPTALMLAPLLLIYSLMLEAPSLTVRSEKGGIRAKIQKALKTTSSFFVLGICLYFFIDYMSPNFSPGGGSIAQYLNTQLYIIFVYLKTFVIPTGLSADTDLQIIKEYFAPKVLLGLFTIGIVLFAAWIFAKQRITLPIAFGILWFFIGLIPSSSFIPLAEMMNHHRTFFPYIGLSMAAVWGCFLLIRKWMGETPALHKKCLVGLMAVAILASHAYGTYQRNEVWHSGESLWLDTTIKSPKNGRGMMNYGLTKMRSGHIEEAILYFEKALDTNYRSHPYLFVNLAIATNVLSKRSDNSQLRREAENYFDTALRLGPRYPQVHYFFSNWLYENGRYFESKKHIDKALKLSPAHKDAQKLSQQISQTMENEIDTAKNDAILKNTAEAFIDLSLQYYQLDKFNQSIEAANSALRLRPDYKLAYNNLCVAKISLQKYQEAIAACEKALELDPEYQLAKNNLRWAKEESIANPK